MREIKQGTDDTVKVWLADDADHMTGKTGLVDGDITVEISKNGEALFTDISAVTVTEAGYGWYNIPLTSSHTDTLGDLVVRATATDADSAERLSSVVANLEVDTYTNLETIKGGGFTNETLEELMAAIKTRLASKSYIVSGASPTGVTVVDGTIASGDYTTMSTINQDYFKVQETGNFTITLDYAGNVTEEFTTFTFAGRYIGSTNHRIDIQIYNYQTTTWDDVLVTPRDIPNTSQDIIIEFDVPGTVSDYFDGTAPNLSAQIRIVHEPAVVVWHELWIDAISFGEIERIYVPADNAGIQSANLGIVNESQKLLSVIESQRGSHTGITNVYYWDPVNGDDTNDGLTPETAKFTYSHLSAGGIHSLLSDSNHDVIIIYPGSPSGPTIIDEYVEIDTRYTFLRGPGRDAFFNYSSSSECAIKLSAEGTELSGVRVNTTSGNTHAVCVEGDFAFIHDIWIDSSRGHGIFINNANHCIVSEFLVEDAATGGGADAIRIDGSGTGARRNLISDGRLINNNGDGIHILGANTGNNMLFGDLAFHDNTGFGINDASTAAATIIIGPSISVAENNSGGTQIQLLGTGSTALNLNQYAEEATLANVQVIAQKAADAAFGSYQLDVPNNQLVLFDESSVEVARWDLTPDYVNPSGKTRV